MVLNFEDTVCAPATPLGSCAITVIRVSGRDALAIADSVVKCRKGRISDAPGYSMKYGIVYKTAAGSAGADTVTGSFGAAGTDASAGSIGDSITNAASGSFGDSGNVLDDVVVSVFRAPHSYTGEDSVEISCHASSFIAGELLGLLVQAGARMAGPGEFTRRAFVNGRMDLAQAEAVADVISASSEAAHRVAVNQLRGTYSSELKTLRDKLLEAAAMMELELDFSEEEVEFADREELRANVASLRDKISALASSFKAGNALKNGVPVAIAGPANAGKSTLLNALLGESRAIVSDIAGTTRDTVEEVLTLGGIQFRFIDTAGLRNTADVIEQMGISRSLEAIGRADIVIGVLDGTLPDERIAADAADLQARCPEGSHLLLVCNKSDIYASEGRGWLNQDGSGTNHQGGKGPDQMEVLMISASSGQGLDELRAALIKSQEGRFSDAGTMVTNLRHYEALTRALKALDTCLSGLDSGLSTELLAEDLRCATSELSSVWGEGGITSQETLNLIFAKHCIGK